MRLLRTMVVVAAGLVLAGAARAADPCAAPASVWGPLPVLAQSAHAITMAHRLEVVALGSSSTAGTGASSPAMTYPAQLATLLRRRFPDVAIEVVNKGVPGETVGQNLARLERDVLALRPDLVIWQVGTNDALRGIDPATVAAQLKEGIARIEAGGGEVVLMEAQFFPNGPPSPAIAPMMAMVQATGHETGLAVLPRQALMRYWLESKQLPAEALVGRDGLHMTDVSYRCLAERIADLFPAVPAEQPLLHAVAATP
jgi:acyl-CoA thioesterase-1